MIPLIVIRPQPGADRTARAARDLGLEVQVTPLFAVSPRAWDAPDRASIDALLIGSANAVRHAGTALASLRDKPAYAVGAETAGACRTAGLSVLATGTGGLQGLLDTIPAGTRLLRLAGVERVALTVPPSLTVTERVVYESQPIPVRPELAELLRRPCVVALHSAAAARHFGGECKRLEVDRTNIRLVTIGPRVTDAGGSGWARVATAAEPTDAALLACAAQLCQNPPGKA